jgi:hypothetical protein
MRSVPFIRVSPGPVALGRWRSASERVLIHRLLPTPPAAPANTSTEGPSPPGLSANPAAPSAETTAPSTNEQLFLAL